MGLANGCSLYFKLDEPTGVPRTDCVSGTLRLTENGTVTSGPGLKGQAAVFNAAAGQSLALTPPPSLPFGDSTWTACFFFKMTDAGPGQYILTKGAGGGAALDWMVYWNGAAIVFSVQRTDGSSAASVSFVTGSSLSPGVWYSLRVYYAKGRGVIGIAGSGGSPMEAPVNGPPNGTAGAVYVGNLFSGGVAGARCSVTGLGFWARELSSDEWAAYHNSGTGNHYPFDRAPLPFSAPGAFGTNTGTGLAAWYAARDLLPANACDVVVVGDSISSGFEATNVEAGGYVDLIRGRLQQLYGGDGHGFQSIQTYQEASVTPGAYQNETWSILGGLVPAPAADWPVRGFVLGLGGGSGSGLRANCRYGDRYDLYVVEGPDTGPFSVDVGNPSYGGVTVTVGASSPSYRLARYALTAPSVGSRDITIWAPVALGTKCFVVGLSSNSGGSGVRVHKVGSAGATVADLFGSSNKLALLGAFPNPKLFVLAASVNDYAAQTPVASYRATMAAAVSAAQATGASVLLVVGNSRAAGNLAVPQAQYNQVLYDLAASTGCALVDLYARWGSPAAALAAGLTAADQSVHPSDLGMNDQAAELVYHLTRTPLVPVKTDAATSARPRFLPRKPTAVVRRFRL